MKTNAIRSIMALLLAFCYNQLLAQTSANFNATENIALTQVKSNLQSSCWQFPDMDVNRSGWVPGIEGDGAMVSGPSSSATQSTGIYTPLLSINGNFTVSFKYKFNAGVTSRRWLKIYFTDDNNNLAGKLDSIELTGASANQVYSYNQSFGGGSSAYRIYINYQGIGGATRIAIDDLQISAAKAYAEGCNQSPVAVNDNFAGNPVRYAQGNVMTNDYDPDAEPMMTTLITPSPDGDVELHNNGVFTFTPNSNFTGTSTSFTYAVCDMGYSPKCSTATVTLNFPSALTLPAGIIDFLAAYGKNKVTLNWTTSFERNNDHFEILRSTDGQTYSGIGTVKSNGNSESNVLYAFTDDIRAINTDKKDLYYRLKQIDKDGKATLTKILIVRVYDTKSLQVVSVTPNPVVNNIKVNVLLNESAMVSMKIMNNGGNEIMRKTVKGISGNNNYELEGTNHLKPGVYLLEVIINSKERMMVKLIKQ